MAGRRWVIASDVAELLGERGVHQLDTVETFTCVCGVRGSVDVAPVIVYVEWDQVEGAPPLYRLGLAHPGCRPSAVVRRPGLAAAMMAAAAAKTPGEASAGFGARERWPRAVLVWSPQVRALTTSGPGRLGVDVWLRSHLEAGFRPLRDPLDVAELPNVAGWTLSVSNEALRLLDAGGDVAYVDLDGGEQFARDRAVGFYAHLDWISRSPDWPMLRLVVAIERQEPRRLVWVPTHLPLAYRSLREAWAGLGLTVAGTGREEQAEAEWAAGMRICLPLLLHWSARIRTCGTGASRSDDRSGSGRSGTPAVRTGGRSATGWGRCWVRGSSRGPSRRRWAPAPHIRRAHYHLYWTGPGRREPRIRWLHPILMGDRQDHELPPTIRRVQAPAASSTLDVVEP